MADERVLEGRGTTTREYPKVTIVTPTLNAERYLEETIESVLGQDYPLIEYLVVDGGSTDATSEMLARYGARVRVLRGNDTGPAEAINRGFREASGDILAWLSSDDTLLPGSVSATVSKFQACPSLGVVYGEANWTASDGSIIGRYPTSPSAVQELWRECLICQPAAFVRRSAMVSVRYLDQRLKSAFDYELWIRLSKIVEFGYLDRHLATSRMHLANLTLSRREAAFEEAIAIQIKHFRHAPLQSVYAYCAYCTDRRDQFFEPLRPSFRACWLSLLHGMRYNRGSRLRFLRECASKLTLNQLRSLIAAKR